MPQFDGQAAVVTGGAAGLGRAIALRLAAEGAHVGLVDIDRPGAEGVAAKSGTDRIEVYSCDVAKRKDVGDAIDAFAGRHGGLDILVNNAVYFHYAPLAEMPEAEIAKVLDVGLKGALFALQASTPHLIARGGGSVVNMSSVAVSFSIPNAAVYSSVKGAIDALTRQQAVELAQYGIRVNALAPGPVRTPGASGVIDDEGWKRRAEKTPLGQLATADEIAAATVFLCSPAGRSISGVTLKIDGAITITGP